MILFALALVASMGLTLLALAIVALAMVVVVCPGGPGLNGLGCVCLGWP